MKLPTVMSLRMAILFANMGLIGANILANFPASVQKLVIGNPFTDPINTIQFDIGNTAEKLTIDRNTNGGLPTITHPVVISGAYPPTPPSGFDRSKQTIELTEAATGPSVNGLKFTAGAKGIQILGFTSTVPLFHMSGARRDDGNSPVASTQW